MEVDGDAAFAGLTGLFADPASEGFFSSDPGAGAAAEEATGGVVAKAPAPASRTTSATGSQFADRGSGERIDPVFARKAGV